MPPITPNERRLLELYCPTFAGCMCNDERGRLCEYHMGWLDGFDAGIDPDLDR